MEVVYVVTPLIGYITHTFIVLSIFTKFRIASEGKRY